MGYFWELRMQPLRFFSIANAMALSLLASGAIADTPVSFLERFNAEAHSSGESPGNAARGQEFFNQTHGNEWRCAACHGAVPTGKGEHAVTHKVIEPMAPAFNPQRFTDVAKVDKWFRRNCKDVLSRECTGREKADVLAWLMSLK
jgi:mono/diheme cytochrome c family protein